MSLFEVYSTCTFEGYFRPKLQALKQSSKPFAQQESLCAQIALQFRSLDTSGYDPNPQFRTQTPRYGDSDDMSDDDVDEQAPPLFQFGLRAKSYAGLWVLWLMRASRSGEGIYQRFYCSGRQGIMYGVRPGSTPSLPFKKQQIM